MRFPKAAASRAPKPALYAWALYDWANAGYATVIQTFVFAGYFTNGRGPRALRARARGAAQRSHRYAGGRAARGLRPRPPRRAGCSRRQVPGRVRQILQKGAASRAAHAARARGAARRPPARELLDDGIESDGAFYCCAHCAAQEGEKGATTGSTDAAAAAVWRSAAPPSQPGDNEPGGSEMAERDTVSLFTEALNVINGALAEHKDATPYEALLRACEKVLGDRPIGVAVYESDPDSPFDYFTIRFRDGTFELVAHGKREPELGWTVSREYLEALARNPREYIENPVKLDWDWLKSRLGIRL